MAEAAFDFKKFIDETKATLLTPADYFSVMPKTGGFAEPIIKALIYGTIGAVINLIWLTLGLGALGGMFGGMLGGGIGLTGLVISIISSIAMIFIGGAIILVISAICSGSTDYEANVRVTASLMALSPITAIFGFLTWVNPYLGGIVTLILSLYWLWMLYNALVKALGGNEGPAKIVSIILAAIPVLMLISGLLCAKAASSFLEKNNDTLPEQLMKSMPADDQEQMKKALEEATKSLELINKEMAEEKKEADK